MKPLTSFVVTQTPPPKQKWEMLFSTDTKPPPFLTGWCALCGESLPQALNDVYSLCTTIALETLEFSGTFSNIFWLHAADNRDQSNFVDAIPFLGQRDEIGCFPFLLVKIVPVLYTKLKSSGGGVLSKSDIASNIASSRFVARRSPFFFLYNDCLKPPVAIKRSFLLSFSFPLVSK